MSRGLRWLRLAAVCAVFLVGLPLLLRGRVTAGTSVLYNVLLGGTALLLFTPRQGRRSLRRQLLWGAAIALGFAAALTGGFLLMGRPVSLLPPRDYAAGAVLGTVVLQALIAGAEELFFRGFLPQELEALALPPWLTAAVPALLFGGLHFFMNGNVIQLCISTAIAAYYLLLRQKGAGLVTLAWAHLLHNLIFFYLIGI